MALWFPLKVMKPPLAAVAAAVLIAMGGTVHSEIRLPHIFGSHMVLQQNKPIVVWGWGSPGESVSVQIGATTENAQANARGEWKVTMPAMSAGAPTIMVVTGVTSTIRFEDVVFGEVWLCSGQSNMEMGLGATRNGGEEIAKADHPMIRLFVVPMNPKAGPQADVEGAWQVCSPAAIGRGGWGGFSAVAYYFGRELHQKLKVPVGLIQATWGGTQIDTWIPPVGFAQIPEFRSTYDRVMLADPASSENKKRLEEFLMKMSGWISTARQKSAAGDTPGAMPVPPPELTATPDQTQPSTLFNGMIHPLQPFAMRGVIWYQGESNHLEGMSYVERMRALVSGWREGFGQPELPLYYVQIAPYKYGDEKSTIVPEFWEVQTAALQIPGTGMIVTTDIGDIDDIHPQNKSEVGYRLALLALAETYGQNEIIYSGPTFKSFSLEGSSMRVLFDHVGAGLVSRDGKPLDWFEIIDENSGEFVPAEATIDGEAVLLRAESVVKPAAVRFGWSKIAQPNLMNKEGLPARPFRAGTVPKRDSSQNLEEALKDYRLVYDVDISRIREKTDIPYDVDEHVKITTAFDRIGYLLELTTEQGATEYVFVSFDAFTTDPEKIAIPSYDRGAIFQQNVTKMDVLSNVRGVATGTGLDGGNIEFWPNSYGAGNAGGVPDASSERNDFGDQIGDAGVGYGSMQVHNHEAQQTIFALNQWGGGSSCDLGIGNNNTTRGEPDWTFAANAATYLSKRLRIYVRLVP